MSRRASLFARQNPGRRRVRFPDEVVFDASVRENDAAAVVDMLRRASLDIDVNRINSAGLTALHQAALDGNLTVVRILTRFGADMNRRDDDSWTPLHAACAMGHHHVARFLLHHGADAGLLTEDGERPLDLVDPSDLATVAAMLQPSAGVGDDGDSGDEDGGEAKDGEEGSGDENDGRRDSYAGRSRHNCRDYGEDRHSECGHDNG